MNKKICVNQLSVKLLAVLIIGYVFSVSASAQNMQNPGNTPDRAFRSEARISPTTLKMSFDLPILTYSGRAGTSLPISISYNSSIWRMDYGGYYQGGPVGMPDDDNFSWVNTIYGDYDSSVGWSSSLEFPKAVFGGGCEHYEATGSARGCDVAGYYFYVKRFRMRMPDGSSHEFRASDNYFSGPPTSQTFPVIYYSVDGSKLKYVEHSSTSWTLYLPDGSRYVSDGGQYFIDANGNKLIYNGGSWTDTLGRIIAIPNLSQPFQAGDVNYSIPSLNGGTQTYIFRWRPLKNITTGESVLTDPSQPLKIAGDTTPFPRSPYEPNSLFQSQSGTKVTPTSVVNPIVISEIQLPNGSKYKFTYNIYGEIDKIIYPTGAYEKFLYAPVAAIEPQNEPYSQLNRGIVERRVSPTGNANDELHWQYSISGVAGNYSPYLNPLAITTTAPNGTSTVNIVNRGRGDGQFGFDDSRAGTTKELKERGISGQTLRRTLTEWTQNGAQTGGFWQATRDARPVREVSVVIEDNQAVARLTETEFDEHADFTYFAHLNPKRIRIYDFLPIDLSTANNADISTIAAMFTSSQLKKIIETDYLYQPSYRDRNLIGKVSETRIIDSATNQIKAKSQIVYDETSYLENAVITNAPNWENPNTSVRGLPTTTRSWIDVAANQSVETHAQYDQFGNVRKNWDATGNITETRYEDNFSDNVNRNSYALPTKTISAVPDASGQNGSSTAFETTVKYDFNTGLTRYSTDANNQTSETQYNDALLRPTKVIAANGHQTISEYGVPDANGQFSAAQRFVKVKTQIDAEKWKEGYSWYDGLGRTIKTQSVDTSGDVLTETEYDQMSRPKRATNLYQTGEIKFWTENFYDDLGRVTKVRTPDNAEVNTAYSLATVGNQIGAVVTVTDQTNKVRRSIANGLGQLIRIDEPDNNGNLGAIDNPTQPTLCSYDTLDNLKAVTQGVQARNFIYDSLSRLKQATNPESGVIQYAYDNNGNLQTKTDARGVTATNSYDALNRVKSKSYSDSTPTVNYFYDNLTNAKGKLIKVSSSVSTTEYTSFDTLGRITGHKQTTDGMAYTTAYSYNLSGALIEQIYPSGRVVKNTFDNDGDLSQVQSRKNQNYGYWTYASAFTYTPSGGVSSMRLGNGRWESTQFNNRLQPTQIALGTTQNQTNMLKLNYDYGQAQNNGNVLSQTITVPTVGQNQGFVATQVYTYDSLNRLKQAQETISGNQTWKQTFLFDRHGNRNFDTNDTTAPSSFSNVTNPQIDSTNNRFTTGQGYTYDLSGNLIADAEGRNFAYDGENKQTSVSNQSGTIGTYFFDGNGKRVKKISVTETTIFVYDTGGKLIAEYSTQIEQNPKVNYLTNDNLGTPRITTDQNGQVVSRSDYLPFGEELYTPERMQALGYTQDSVRQGFTGYIKDDETGLDFAEARMYANRLGRFTGVDSGPFNPSDPQNFNRYVYVQNNPMKFIDPTGKELSILGDDADFIVRELEKYSGYKLKRDPKTGKVTILNPNNRNAKNTSKSLADKLKEIIKDTKSVARISTVKETDEAKDNIYFDGIATTATSTKKGVVGNRLDVNDYRNVEKDSSEFAGTSLGHVLFESYELAKAGNVSLADIQNLAEDAHDKARRWEANVLSDLTNQTEQFVSEREMKRDEIYRFTYTNVAFDIVNKTTNPNVITGVKKTDLKGKKTP